MAEGALCESHELPVLIVKGRVPSVNMNVALGASPCTSSHNTSELQNFGSSIFRPDWFVLKDPVNGDGPNNRHPLCPCCV